MLEKSACTGDGNGGGRWGAWTCSGGENKEHPNFPSPSGPRQLSSLSLTNVLALACLPPLRSQGRLLPRSCEAHSLRGHKAQGAKAREVNEQSRGQTLPTPTMMMLRGRLEALTMVRVVSGMSGERERGEGGGFGGLTVAPGDDDSA